MLTIGGVRVDPPVALAPMAGITDAAFRALCREMGAGLVYTEMVSAEALVRDNARSWQMTQVAPGERPVALQIFGADPGVMAEAAARIMNREGPPDFLDVNLGCPVPKVVRSGAGAALMRDPSLACEVVRAVSEAVAPRPVTVKIRSGWDEASINAPDLAVRLEEAGAAAIAVHGRTRRQFYGGQASWEVISRVRTRVSVPVIGNGDVTGPEAALDMVRKTGVPAVMVGRAALGNPWVFRQIKAAWEGGEAAGPTRREIGNMMVRHLNLLISIKGENRAVREMRKHAAWYIKGQPGARSCRAEFMRAESRRDMVEIVARALSDCDDRL